MGTDKAIFNASHSTSFRFFEGIRTVGKFGFDYFQDNSFHYQVSLLYQPMVNSGYLALLKAAQHAV